MADDRGADYLASENEKYRIERIRRMMVRREIMQQMVASVGLADHSNDLSVIEKIISRNLEEAYALMSTFIRAEARGI